MTTQLDDETHRIVEKVQKLLKLAERGGTEAEAAAAAGKAQELLAAYNLDMATVERASGAASGKREDAAVAGGVYTYQRDLWRAVAELNFCLYWTNRTWVTVEVKRKLSDGTTYTRNRDKRVHQHRVVGRIVNTTLTRTMAAYLEAAIERLCRERFPENSQFFASFAVAYREGMADRVMEKLQERRAHLIDEETKRREAEQAAARAAGRASSTDTALSLVVLVDAEHDANMDHLYGEGWSAKRAQSRAERALREAEADRIHAEWAAANPEEAAAEAKKQREENRKYWARRRGRGGWSTSPSDERRSSSHYRQGYEKGGDIGLDPQTGDGRAARRIAR